MSKILIFVLISSSLLFGTSEVLKFTDNWGRNPLFNIVTSSDAGMEIIFSCQQTVVEETTIDGVPMKTFGVPGMFLPNDEGAPNLQGTGRYIAIPQGATAKVTIVDKRTEIYKDIKVAPAPNIPLDSDDSPLRYVKNMDIYSKNAYYPDTPVKLSEPMQIRGVDCVILGITPFQYNPVTKELIVYKDIRVRIDFEGGNGHFGDDVLRNPYWEPMLQGHLLNYSSLPELDYTDYYAKCRTQTKDGRDGVEYIIIVPDDATFIAWGDTIKNWRKLQGISTDVFTLTEIGGSTTTAIENFLNTAYNTWSPRPVAFLILSDYPATGDVYGVTSPIWNSYCVSDNIYADVNGDNLPDMYHARICAQTASQLSIMINKFLSYERNPYTSVDFYNKPITATAWQTERWFQLCGEVIRGFLKDSTHGGLKKNPTRQCNIYSGTPVVGGAWSTAQNTSTVVIYFYNRGWLTSMTNPYDATWWNNGSASQITTAINNGAFLLQHRDHGGETGWGEPAYSNSDINNLTNTQYIFVNSSNCLTGKYNWTSECFTEKFHRVQYGALGLNAASEVSYSFVNDAYVWGMYDCMWQQFMTDYPATDLPGHSVLRPCIAMNYGKYFLQASGWPYNTSDKTVTYHLFHHHGDAFQTLYSQVPQNLTVSHASTLSAGSTSFTVTANDSSVIALTVNNEIIGVALGTGSPVSITIPSQTAGNTMKVTVTKANYYRYQAPVLIMSSKDVGVTAIAYPIGTVDSTGSIIPRARVKNFGADSVTFQVTFKIGGIYTSSRAKKLNAGVEDTVNFSAWGSPRGTYTMRCSTYVSGDANSSNDTMSGSITVIVNDVGVTSITVPDDTIYLGVLAPKATVKNYGTDSASFYSFFKIIDTLNTQVYFDSSYVNKLAPNKTSTRTFKEFLFQTGRYSLRCSTALSNDNNPLNNVKLDSVVVLFLPPWVLKDSVLLGPNNKGVKGGGALTVGIAGKIYGLKGNNTREFYIYDIDRDSWAMKESIPYDPLNKKKVNKGAALAYNKNSDPDIIYATKGNNTLEFWAYDVDNDSWIRKPDVPYNTIPVKKVKGGAGLTFLRRSSRDYIYLLKGNRTLEFYAFHCQGDSWIKSLTDAPFGPDFKSFKDGSCITTGLNNKLYALKGGARYNEFWCYDASFNTWTELESLPRYDSLLNKSVKVKDGASLCFDGDSLIYAFKGGNRQSFWVYNINRNFWQEKDTIPRGTGGRKVSSGGALAYADDKVYALKGNRTLEFLCWTPYLSDIRPAQEKIIAETAEKSERKFSVNSACSVVKSGDQISITPNPVTNHSEIKINLVQPSKVNISLYNSVGQLLNIMSDREFEQGLHYLPLSLNGLTFGVYYLRCNVGQKINTIKVIIE